MDFFLWKFRLFRNLWGADVTCALLGPSKGGVERCGTLLRSSRRRGQALWTVAKVELHVELHVKGQHVMVTVEAGPGPSPCPDSQERAPGSARTRRRWWHLDPRQFTTWIQASLPRVSGPP